MPAQPHVDLAAVTARLQARRDELLRLTAEHEDEGAPVELDQARVGRLSRMDALQSQALAAEVERRREVELERIDMALERIEQGEYGYCVACASRSPRSGWSSTRQRRCASAAPSAPAELRPVARGAERLKSPTISRWTAT